MKRILLNLLLLVFINDIIAQTQIGVDINGEAASNLSGTSVALSGNGNVLAVGAPANSANGTSSGHVRVYQNVSNTWTQIGADIDGREANVRSGWSVSLSNDGSKLAIGSVFIGGQGFVRVYQRIANTWTQLGVDIIGASNFDYAGCSVSLSSDGNIVAIGASESVSGRVQVFQNVGGTWTQIGTNITGEVAGDKSGFSVSLSDDGTVVAIGAPKNDGNGANSGQVRVYAWNGTAWVLRGVDIDGEAAGDEFGTSVSLSSNGMHLAIGGKLNDGNGSDSGHVRIFSWNGSAWIQAGVDINGESAVDYLGTSVSICDDATRVAIGAPNNDGNGTNSGHVRIFNLTSILSSNEFVFNNFSLYPNPIQNEFQLDINFLVDKVEIVTLQGQVIKTFGNQESYDISDLSSGMYVLSIHSNEGNSVKKIIKN